MTIVNSAVSCSPLGPDYSVRLGEGSKITIVDSAISRHR